MKFKSMEQTRKKIIVFTCRGGGCHIAVHQALQEYLSDSYEIIVADFFNEVLGKFDCVQLITRSKYTSEDIYNYLISRHNFSKRMFSCLVPPLLKMLPLLHGLIERAVLQYVRQSQPDLVISVIPIFNGIFARTLKKLDIPFLLIPLDLDVHALFMNGLSKEDAQVSYCALPFSDSMMKHRQTNNLPFQPENISITGYPLRPAFFQQKDEVMIKSDFSIAIKSPVIMLLMGGAGSISTKFFYQNLLSLDIPCHIVACLGRNERLNADLAQITLPAHITSSIIGYTNRIADLMSVAQVLITKPGPGSVCEALYLNTPMILDGSGATLFWERFHLEFVKNNGLGDVMWHTHELNKLVSRYLLDYQYVQQVKENQRRFDKKVFSHHITKVVSDILEMRS